MRIKVVVAALILLATASAYGQSNTRERVYVWEFHSNIKDPDLIDNITDEFETALLATGRYEVVERRQLSRLLSRRDNEVTDMANLGASDATLLKGKGAQDVFFGKVINDPDSGSVRLTVTLESFDSSIQLKKSVRMRPVELRDDRVRDEKYKELLGINSERHEITPDTIRDAQRPTFTNPQRSTSNIDVSSFQYHALGDARGAIAPMVRVRFDWNVANLPEGRCTYQILAGNVVVAQGLQTGQNGRAEVTYNATLRDLTKTLTIACGSKSSRSTAVGN